MKSLMMVAVFLWPLGTFSQYYTDFDSWAIHAEGSWSESEQEGTYYSSGCYCNFGNTSSGLRKVGFNNSGDELELPPADYVRRVSFGARLSSSSLSRLKVEYNTGSNWVSAGEVAVSGTEYDSYSVLVNVFEQDVRLRIRMIYFGKSVFMDGLGVSVWDGPLPVEFGEFRARPRPGQRVELSWTTYSETDNAYFLIERSREGGTFQAIGRVRGAGNSLTPRHYTFTDHRPLSGANYYRLRQVDTDGSYTYSALRSVRVPFDGVQLYPTVARDRLTLEWQDWHPESTLQVIGPNGSVVDHWRIPTRAGRQEIDLSSLRDGRYWIVDPNHPFPKDLGFIKQ